MNNKETIMIPFLSLKDVTASHGAGISEAVNRVANGGWYPQGKGNERFEGNYSQFIEAKYIVDRANGLDALTWILRVYLEVGVMQRGDEVIVPANTHIATILAIIGNGLKPILVEPKLSTLEIDDDRMEEVITPWTKTTTTVHLYGRIAYTEKIDGLCKRYHLKLAEDCVQSHGRLYSDDRMTGNIGDAAGHSLYPSKNPGTLGDGGIMTTNDEELAKVIHTLANYDSQKKYVFKYTGRNSRLDEVQAAVLNVKLEYLVEDNTYRKLVAKYYIDNIRNPLVLIPDALPYESNTFRPFFILREKRDELHDYLEQNDVGTITHYSIASHKQECYKEWNDLCSPITEYIADHELSLPIGPTILMEDVKRVAGLINKFKQY